MAEFEFESAQEATVADVNSMLDRVTCSSLPQARRTTVARSMFSEDPTKLVTLGHRLRTNILQAAKMFLQDQGYVASLGEATIKLSGASLPTGTQMSQILFKAAADSSSSAWLSRHQTIFGALTTIEKNASSHFQEKNKVRLQHLRTRMDAVAQVVKATLFGSWELKATAIVDSLAKMLAGTTEELETMLLESDINEGDLFSLLPEQLPVSKLVNIVSKDKLETMGKDLTIMKQVSQQIRASLPWIQQLAKEDVAALRNLLVGDFVGVPLLDELNSLDITGAEELMAVVSVKMSRWLRR